MTENQQLLPVVEEFYTIQGEGFYSGNAAYFIRLAGCDVGCTWCDTKNSWSISGHQMKPVDRIIEGALQYPGNLVVITGGEPLMHNLEYLSRGFMDSGVTLMIETSGVYPVSGVWDWICLSPKKHRPPLSEIYKQANELKVVISEEKDLEWAVRNSLQVSQLCKLYLQPEWSAFRSVIPVIVNFIKQNPAWSISLQSHKFMRIP